MRAGNTKGIASEILYLIVFSFRFGIFEIQVIVRNKTKRFVFHQLYFTQLDRIVFEHIPDGDLHVLLTGRFIYDIVTAQVHVKVCERRIFDSARSEDGMVFLFHFVGLL